MVIGIVGGGPAGISCALILSRYKIDVLLFEKREIGGLVINARRLDNIPGLTPISGKDFAVKLREDLKKNLITPIFENVISVQAKQIKTDQNQHYEVDQVVLATGTKPVVIQEWDKYPNLVYEWRDLPEQFDSLAIYGAGDAAFDSGLYALDQNKKVCIFNRNQQIKALEILKEQFILRGGHYFPEEPVLEIQPSICGLSIRTKNRIQSFDALLVSIGREKNIDLITSHDSPIQIGDLQNHPYRQASIAIGDGVKAGLMIAMQRKEKWI